MAGEYVGQPCGRNGVFPYQELNEYRSRCLKQSSDGECNACRRRTPQINPPSPAIGRLVSIAFDNWLT